MSGEHIPPVVKQACDDEFRAELLKVIAEALMRNVAIPTHGGLVAEWHPGRPYQVNITSKHRIEP